MMILSWIIHGIIYINCNYNMPTFSTLARTSNDHPNLDFDNLLESMEFNFNNLDEIHGPPFDRCSLVRLLPLGKQ